MLEFEIEEAVADRNIEGGYRRGYHQAVAMLAEVLEQNPNLTAETLRIWIETEGMHWRNDLPLDRKIVAPSFSV